MPWRRGRTNGSAPTLDVERRSSHDGGITSTQTSTRRAHGPWAPVGVIVIVLTALTGVALFAWYHHYPLSGEALELYRLSMRRYPSTAEGLQALASPGFAPHQLQRRARRGHLRRR